MVDASQIDPIVMPPVDVTRYLHEDATNTDGPQRFAAQIPVSLSSQTTGLWESLPGGGKLWRVRISSPGAASLNFAIAPFHLPPSATLHLYAADGSYVEGPFDASDNIPEKELWTPVVRGDDVILELFLPSSPLFQPELGIAFVNHGYRDLGSLGAGDAVGCQGNCNNDVICPEGDPWRDEIRSVALYQRDGFLVCTGTLLNSWNQVPPPYFLTSNSCGVTDLNDHTVVVYWNHQSLNCGDLGGGNLNQNQTGSIFRAARAQSDFTLLELATQPDPSFNVNYAGWDRTGVSVSRSTGIHHPCAAEKAISINTDLLSITSYLGDASPGDGTHWRLDDWEDGVTEPGSGGSALWDQRHRVVGQLHGGFSSCSQPNERDWYGRLSVSWGDGPSPSTRLRDWLDPSNTNFTVDGTDGACNTTALTSGVTTTSTGSFRNYEFNQTEIYWSAIGIRPTGSDNWTVRMREDLAPHPECLTGHGSEGSQSGQVSFVIVDYNHVTPTTGYVKTYRQFAGAFPTGTVEWDGGADQLIVNGARITRTTGPADVLEVWDVFLQQGVTYTFEFNRFGGADTKMMLERNPFNGGLYTIRGYDFEEFESASTINYTAPASDWYGLVVVNDNGLAGSYELRVGTCTTPVSLASGVSVFTPASQAYYSINQQVIYWTAIGVRDPGSDWDIAAYAAGGGGAWPVCFSNHLASSPGVGIVDFVIGDFNSGQNPLGTYFINAYQYSGVGNARTEWDNGSEQLPVGAPPTSRTTGALDVLEVWDVFLEGGVDYDFFFERTGAADTKLLFFRSFGGVYWTGRSAAVFETTNLHTLYTAPVSDWYGVVVVNDNGSDGTYRVGVGFPNLAVDSDSPDGASPQMTRLHPVAPNPAPGPVRFGFELARPGSVALDVLDVTGRIVASLPAQTHGAGTWDVPWEGASRDKALPSGLYWVKMSVDAREVGRSRFVLLR